MNRVLVLSALTLFVACSPTDPSRPCTVSSDCADDESCRDGFCETLVTADAAVQDARGDATTADMVITLPVVDLRIEPSSVDLVATVGENPTVDFALFLVLSDGSEREFGAAEFAIDSSAIGDVDPGSGVFTANGIAGGVSIVTATAPGQSDVEVTATVQVNLEQELFGPDVPNAAKELFANPVQDDARKSQLAYPLEGAVMPQNVFPADLQWLMGADADTLRVRLSKPHFSATAYLQVQGRHWIVDEAVWKTLARTDPTEEAMITVDRHDGVDAVLGDARSFTFASAALTGAVYYWDIAAGQILRINDGTATAEAFMPTPPVDRAGSDCVGCHTVSKSGRYMAGRLGGGENVGAVFDLTKDLTVAEPPTEFPVVPNVDTTMESARWWFSSWSPDDTRLVLSTAEGTATRPMVFLDPFTGVPVTMTGTLPTNITQPDWSPDGTQIAYVTNVNSWGGAFTAGDIGVLDVTGVDTVGDHRVVHAGADLAASSPGGTADSYPSWSPDSAKLAFSHGTGTRSDDQQAALYMMKRDGTDPLRLDRANGTNLENFQPRFSPFESGGYFWLSFLSKRDYGNDITGTLGASRQQIWVTAIRTDAADGEDPSSVPYWLPGQRTVTQNISAYWAPRPCREDGDGCSVGSECCGGDCRPDAGGALVCSPPPPERCRMENQTCSTDEDCCGDGLTCFNRVCLAPIN